MHTVDSSIQIHSSSIFFFSVIQFTSKFNFCKPIRLPNKRPTSSNTSSGRTRHDILFSSLFNFICLSQKIIGKKRERCGKNMNRVESTMSCDCINFTAIYTVEKPYYSTGIESTYLHIRYATRPPNTTNTMNANVP